MSWCWLALLHRAPDGALAAAAARHLNGSAAGMLAAWPREQRRRPGATRVDARVIDANGPEMAVSLVLAPRGVRVLFDDPAVVGAIRRALERPDVAFVSTLVTDPVHFAGAVTGIRDPWPGWWSDDPFATIYPARRLIVDAGLFGVAPLPAGPGHQRYGFTPWPVEGFE